MRTYVLRGGGAGRGVLYTRKGDDQQASYCLCNLNPFLCALFIFIHIIDCGYSLEPFNDAHEKTNQFLQLIELLILKDL